MLPRGESESAYQKLHGADPKERLAYVGEKVFFFVPAKRRSNLDLRWSAGIYLSTSPATCGATIGLPTGDVARAQGVARLRPDQRWDANTVNKLRGQPWQPSLGPDDSVLECLENPHLHLDAGAREGEMEDTSPIPKCLSGERKLPSRRITKPDFVKYGHTGVCPRCTDTQTWT